MIAALLIVQRVANRSALTSDTIVTGGISSFHFRSRGEPTRGSRTLSIEYPMVSVDNYEKDTGGPGIQGVETTSDFRKDSEV